MQGDAMSNKNISLVMKSPLYKMKLTTFFCTLFLQNLTKQFPQTLSLAWKPY